MTTKTPERATSSSSKQRQFVKPDFINEPLATLFSTRLRLTDEERSKLKEAYNAAYNSSFTPQSTPAIGGSSLSVSTSYGASRELDLKLGMGRIAAVDVISTRDTVPLPIILKMQKVLEVEIITADRLEEAFKNYIQYVFSV